MFDMEAIARQIIALAEKHLGKGDMVSSAELCLEDARRQFGLEEFRFAADHALRSVSYSVGVMHDDYLMAKAFLDTDSAVIIEAIIATGRTADEGTAVLHSTEPFRNSLDGIYVDGFMGRVDRPSRPGVYRFKGTFDENRRPMFEGRFYQCSEDDWRLVKVESQSSNVEGVVSLDG